MDISRYIIIRPRITSPQQLLRAWILDGSLASHFLSSLPCPKPSPKMDTKPVRLSCCVLIHHYYTRSGPLSLSSVSSINKHYLVNSSNYLWSVQLGGIDFAMSGVEESDDMMRCASCGIAGADEIKLKDCSACKLVLSSG